MEIKVRWLFSAENLQYLKWFKTGPALLLFANKKLHSHFRLVPKLSILDDL